MRELKLASIFMLLWCSQFAFSQKIEIRGSVTDETGAPIENATVKDGDAVAVSAADGSFVIQGQVGDNVSVEKEGYEPQDQILSTPEEELFYMLFKTTSVQVEKSKEVVVIGYGSQKKELVSGSYATLKSDELLKSTPVRMEDALQGKAAGVQVTQASGAPGSSPNIRIRGVTTNGDNSPLVIVDGMNYGTDLSVINPNDIESINIIKDASTAIYGVQGANGVILVTTKSGKKGKKPTFSYNGSYGIAEVAHKINVMNASEYAAYINEAEVAAGNSVLYKDPLNLGIGDGSDWQNQVFDLAPQMSHDFRVLGGTETSTYSFGAGYVENKGTAQGDLDTDKSIFRRFNLDAKYNVDLSEKIKLNNTVFFANTQSKKVLEDDLGSIIFNAINMSPIITIYDGKGDYQLADGLGNEIINPLAQIANTYNLTKVARINGQSELQYSPIKNLQFTTRLNAGYSLVEAKNFYPEVFYGNGKVQNIGNIVESVPVFDNTKSSVTEEKTKYFDYSWETFLNYDLKYKENHNFNVLAGMSFRKETGNNIFGKGYQVPYNSWEYASLGNTKPSITLPDESNSWDYDTRWTSFYGRLQYDYKKKYLLSAMIRRDASSKFGPENRVGYFPAVSAGWVVSKEGFFSSEFINFLKLRGSWGITGNDKIVANAYRSSLDGKGEYVFDGSTLVTGSAIGKIPNSKIKWETNQQTDLGIDLRIWKNKIDITADYFYKKTEDLLLTPQVAGTIGASAPGSSAPVVNGGSVENRGFEFGINYKENITDDFSFNIAYNFTTYKNKALQVNTESGFIEDGKFDLSTKTSRFETGFPIGYFYGYKTDGIFQNATEVANSPYFSNATAMPGDLRFVDMNGDGVINEKDKTDLGSPHPDVMMGISLGLNYKSFDFSVAANAVLGNEVVRAYERFVPYANRLDYYLGRWTGEGTSNEIPRATNGATRNREFSDFYVEDGSFVRISNIQLGYSLPQSLLDAVHLTKFRIYFSVNNLYTFTKYKGYDPEISIGSPAAAGVDRGQYPRSRVFLTGLNVTF